MDAEAERILVVGGGVIGLSTAYYLARREVPVLVLERDRVGAGASSGNAGAIAPGHSTLARPGRILQALRWLGDPTRPLYIPPRWDPSLFRWLWHFNRFCTEAHVHRSMEILGPMGHLGRELFDEVMEEEGIECHYRTEGYYEVYQTPKGLDGAREEIPLQHAHGYQTAELNAEALREREPALTAETEGGLFFPEAASTDPDCFLEGLTRAAVERGAEVRTGSSVQEIRVEGGRARGVRLDSGEILPGRAVVLATGAYSLDLGRPGGLTLPIQAAKGYHRDMVDEGGEAPEVGMTFMAGETFVFHTPMGGFLRLAGTLELSGTNHRMVPARLENLTDSARRYLEGLEGASSRDDWVGLRPVTPDGLPMVGPAPEADGLWVADGHAMLGLTLGPVTGKLLAEWMLDGAPSLDLSLLRPDRF